MKLACRLATIAPGILLGFSLSACSTGKAYVVLQDWQRQSCNDYREQSEHKRCMERSETSYEDYKAARGKLNTD